MIKILLTFTLSLNLMYLSLADGTGVRGGTEGNYSVPEGYPFDCVTEFGLETKTCKSTVCTIVEIDSTPNCADVIGEF